MTIFGTYSEYYKLIYKDNDYQPEANFFYYC